MHPHSSPFLAICFRFVLRFYSFNKSCWCACHCWAHWGNLFSPFLSPSLNIFLPPPTLPSFLLSFLQTSFPSSLPPSFFFPTPIPYRQTPLYVKHCAKLWESWLRILTPRETCFHSLMWEENRSSHYIWHIKWLNHGQGILGGTKGTSDTVKDSQ